MRRLSGLLLAAILLINVGSPTAFCAPFSNQKSNPAKHCKMSQATTVLPCCRQARATSQTFDRAASTSCCRLSPPLPNRSATTLPALSAKEFKGPVQADVETTSFRSEAFRASADVLSIAFLANRSGTYLQLSALRI